MGQIKLTKNQSNLLKTIYTYRFTNRQLLIQTLNITSGPMLYRRLQVLVQKKLIGIHYDKKDKLLGRPIIYFVTPLGIRTLATGGTLEIPQTVIKQNYRDKQASLTFIDHNVTVHATANSLMRQYPALRVFSKRDMARYSYFPSMLPDLFLSHRNEDGEPSQFFLDVISDQNQQFKFDQRLNHYLDYFEAGEWEVVSEELPTLLFVASSPALEQRIAKWAHKSMTQKYSLDISILTTTVQALQVDDSHLLAAIVES